MKNTQTTILPHTHTPLSHQAALTPAGPDTLTPHRQSRWLRKGDPDQPPHLTFALLPPLRHLQLHNMWRRGESTHTHTYAGPDLDCLRGTWTPDLIFDHLLVPRDLRCPDWQSPSSAISCSDTLAEEDEDKGQTQRKRGIWSC